jgi:hypothetical protein
MRSCESVLFARRSKSAKVQVRKSRVKVLTGQTCPRRQHLVHHSHHSHWPLSSLPIQRERSALAVQKLIQVDLLAADV